MWYLSFPPRWILYLTKHPEGRPTGSPFERISDILLYVSTGLSLFTYAWTDIWVAPDTWLLWLKQGQYLSEILLPPLLGCAQREECWRLWYFSIFEEFPQCVLQQRCCCYNPAASSEGFLAFDVLANTCYFLFYSPCGFKCLFIFVWACMCVHTCMCMCVETRSQPCCFWGYCSYCHVRPDLSLA